MSHSHNHKADLDNNEEKESAFEAPVSILEVPGLRVEVAAHKPEITALLEQARQSNQPVQLPGGQVVRLKPPPTPEPLEPGDYATILPTGAFPAYLKLCRWGKGFCGIRQDGQIAVTWLKFPLRDDRAFTYSWNNPDGASPVSEIVQIEGQSGILLHEKEHGQTKLVFFLRSGQHDCWLARGDLPREEIIRLAEGLLQTIEN